MLCTERKNNEFRIIVKTRPREFLIKCFKDPSRKIVLFKYLIRVYRIDLGKIFIHYGENSIKIQFHHSQNLTFTNGNLRGRTMYRRNVIFFRSTPQLTECNLFRSTPQLEVLN